METPEQQQNPSPEPEVKASLSGVYDYVRGLFAIGSIDYAKATENIRSDVSFRGFNIWILICSILVCSLGLNLNSTPVVIGAMLISPLMGPINGLGLAIGTYDRPLLRKSLINLAVASGVSVLTAFIFFRITPTGNDLHELFSRKTPVILDLFIAFFGGVAGILAASRCISTNVVPGVAIATALMPPLCTTGYGLATGQMDYFLGAFYLFFMNCVMISLAAVIIVVYLKYPKFSFVNDRMKRKVRGGIFLFVLLFSIPSIVLYYNLITESRENERIAEFIEKELSSNRSIYVDDYDSYETDSSKVIRVSIKGQYLEESTCLAIQNRMANYKLNDYTLKIIQSEKKLGDDEIVSLGQQFKVDILTDLYDKNEQQLKSKQDEIELLQNEVRRLSHHNLATEKLGKMVKSQFNIDQFAIDNVIYFGQQNPDTVLTALVMWSRKAKRSEELPKLQELLKIQLDSDEIVVHSLN